jgi:TM2 domain-containing membrane protein YozV
MDPQSPYSIAPPPKDPNTAFLIELVGGLFGLLGLGYFYVGRTNDGLVRLIALIVYELVAYGVIAVLTTVTAGIAGCICAPIQLVIQLGVAFWSANNLKNDMLKQQTNFMR